MSACTWRISETTAGSSDACCTRFPEVTWDCVWLIWSCVCVRSARYRMVDPLMLGNMSAPLIWRHQIDDGFAERAQHRQHLGCGLVGLLELHHIDGFLVERDARHLVAQAGGLG